MKIFLFPLIALAASSPFSEPITDSAGIQRCCLTNVRTCEKDCKKKNETACIAACYKTYCVSSKLTCFIKPTPSAVPSASPVLSEPEVVETEVKKVQQPTIRYDGALTGPGNVNFELENVDGKERRVRVIGIIFAMDAEGGQVVLKKSPLETIQAGSSTQISLEVGEEEYARWKDKHSEIRLGITYPDSFESQGWQFENQLTEEDLKKARGGEFIVRGRFRKGAVQ